MFGLFSKPKWQHKDPAVRTPAVKALSGDELQDALPTLLQDSEAEIRLIAIGQLTDLDQLKRIAQDDSDKNVRHNAHRRRLDLLTGAIKHFNASDLQSKAQQETDAATLLHIATKANDASLRQSAQQQLTEASVLVQIMMAETDTTLRTELLNRISDFALLENAQGALKRQDKSFVAEVENRIAVLKLEQGDPETIRAAQEKLCRQIEALSATTDFDNTKAKLKDVQGQWDELIAKGGNNELEPRYRRGLAVIERIFHEMQRLESGEATMEPEKPAEPSNEEKLTRWSKQAQNLLQQSIDTESELNSLREDIKQLNSELADIEASAEATALQKQLSQKIADKAEAIQGPFAALCEQAETINIDGRAIRGLEKRWEKESAKRRPPAHQQTRFEKAIAAAQEKLDNAKTQATKKLAKLEQEIAAQQTALDDGNLQDARSKLHKIEAEFEQIKRILDSKVIAECDRLLRTLAQNVAKMSGWQRWGNDRVREELCETLEALHSEDIPAEQKLAALKEAQASWKKLDQAEKGAGRRGNDTWNRFQEAANQLFEQCKPFLEQRQAERAEKRTAVEALAAKLRAFNAPAEDSDETLDAKGLLAVIREGRAAMRDIGQLAHKDRGAAAKTLRSALDHASGLLTQHTNAIADAKRAIIAKAEALLEGDDTRAAIEEAKRLQQAWKNAGSGDRKTEQALWKDFRAVCDQIFNRRDEERNAQRAESDKVRTELESLCEQAETLGKLDPIAAAEQQADFRKLADAFNEHDTRGKHLARTVKRFQDAETTFAAQVKKAKLAKMHDEIDQLISAANLCAELEAGNEIERASIEAHPLLSGRLSRADDAANADDALINEQTEMGAKRCMQLEFLAGIDSPAELKDARMQYQIDRMSSAMMGNKSEGITEALDAIKAWVALGPLRDANVQHARVSAAWDALKNS